MPVFRFTSHTPLILLPLLAALSGCGEDGKWFEAVAAQGIYEAEATVQAVDAGGSPLSADKSCETIIKFARESLDDPAYAVTGIQAMAQPCNQVGMEFDNAVRCESGRLQVLCR